MPIAGSCAQLIAALKRAAELPSTRPAKQTRVSQRFRGYIPATNRAEMRDNAAPDDYLTDSHNIDSAVSDQGDDDPIFFYQPAQTVEDLLGATEPVLMPPSPFMSDQLWVIQNTVQPSISQVFNAGQIHPGTSVSQAQPHSQPRPSGTAAPLGLHRLLDKNLEDKILWGEYIDFTLLLPDSAH